MQEALVVDRISVRLILFDVHVPVLTRALPACSLSAYTEAEQEAASGLNISQPWCCSSLCSTGVVSQLLLPALPVSVHVQRAHHVGEVGAAGQCAGGVRGESTTSNTLSADNGQESAKISKSEKRVSRVISSALHMDEKLSCSSSALEMALCAAGASPRHRNGCISSPCHHHSSPPG